MNSKVELFQDKIKNLSNATSHDLNVVALWMIHYKKQSTALTDAWFNCFISSNLDQKCKLVSIIDFVCDSDKDKAYVREIALILQHIFTHFLHLKVSPQTKNFAMTILQKWASRGYFEKVQVDGLIQKLTQAKIKCYENELCETYNQILQIEAEQQKSSRNTISSIDAKRLTSYNVNNVTKLEGSVLMKEMNRAIRLQKQSNELITKELDLKKCGDELVAKLRRYQSIGFPLSNRTIGILAEKVKPVNGTNVGKVEELQAKIKSCASELFVVYDRVAKFEEENPRVVKDSAESVNCDNVLMEVDQCVKVGLPVGDKTYQSNKDTVKISRKRKLSYAKEV